MFAGGSRTFWLGLGAENEVHCAHGRAPLTHKSKKIWTRSRVHTSQTREENRGVKPSRAFFGASSPGPFQRRHVRAAHRESHTLRPPLLFGAIGMWRCATGARARAHCVPPNVAQDGATNP